MKSKGGNQLSKCAKCLYAIHHHQHPQIPAGQFACKLTSTIIQTVAECPHFASIDSLCPLCGDPIPPNTGFIPHDQPMLLCNACGQHLYGCGTCKHRAECAIENYSGSKPKFVMKTIQKGPITQQFQILNPELEEELCPKCICGGRTNCQNLHRCSNYEFILKEGK